MHLNLQEVFESLFARATSGNIAHAYCASQSSFFTSFSHIAKSCEPSIVPVAKSPAYAPIFVAITPSFYIIRGLEEQGVLQGKLHNR